ncbi:MAG: AAA family ATPase [Actinobacteria bacterium]|nr:AAA family ATPase [Actinomycetota bacterium]
MQIRRVRVERFRGIKELVWCPGPGINCLIGPGDSGKSTILDAISLVLSPAPGRVASEHDYYGANVGAGFKVDLLVGQLDEAVLSAWPAAPLWTWLPSERRAQAKPDPEGEGVLCLRATGTDDLEIAHTVIDPSDGELPLSPSKRQAFGLSRIASPSAAYRDLRMSRGSLLTRNVQPDQLRALVTEAMQATRDDFSVPKETAARLQELSEALQAVAPGAGKLDLAILSPLGQNLLSSVGLFGVSGEFAVPLASAGLGTQQLALFVLASMLIAGSPLFVIDEIESGLEPFRQRDLIARIRKAIGNDGQAFVTTHSPSAVGEMAINELHRVSSLDEGSGRVLSLPKGLDAMRSTDPEALLCRLPLILEGQTEVGVLEPILKRKATEAGTTLGALGVRLVDGGGQPKLFAVTDALVEAGESFGVFLDEEDIHKGRRAALGAVDGVVFGTYTDAGCFEEALSKQLSLLELDRLIAAPDGAGWSNADARYQQLNGDLGNQSRKTLVELENEIGEEDCRVAFSTAAKKRGWFKTLQASLMVGEYLCANHPQIQLVRDGEAFWASILSLVPIEVSSEGS